MRVISLPFRSHFVRVPCLLALALAIVGSNSAYAVLELVNDNAAWPTTAPVRTQSIPSFSAASRGVRGDRLQYQTFEVTQALSLQSVMIGYGWVGGTTGGSPETNFTKIKIYEITRTYNPPTLEDAFTLGNVVVPQISFVIDGTGKSTNAQFYAMELAWDAETSGELVLQPRTGLEGYAIEINGTHVGAGSSAINLIERNGNPNNVYPGGRAYELINGAATGPYGNGLYEFPIVLTAVSAGADGDYNNNGTVDAGDYVAWRKGGTLHNEMHIPGTISAEDYTEWRARFGNPPGSGAGLSAVAVPEPTAVALIGAVLLFPLKLRRRSRALTRAACMALVATVGATFLWTGSTEAGLIVNNWDARSSYPSSTAPVYTSDLPYFGPSPPASPNSDSVGIRTTRLLTQTFDVTSNFDVQSIFIGYRLNPDLAKVATIRIVSIPDVNAAYASPTVLASIDVTTPTPYGGTGERYRALQLDWQDSLPLTLSPQAGAAGYALEVLGQNPQAGTPNGSPIAFVFRTSNPYPMGRAFDLNNASTPAAADDFVLAITGQTVPEPSAFLLVGMCVVALNVAAQQSRIKYRLPRSTPTFRDCKKTVRDISR